MTFTFSLYIYLFTCILFSFTQTLHFILFICAFKLCCHLLQFYKEAGPQFLVGTHIISLSTCFYIFSTNIFNLDMANTGLSGCKAPFIHSFILCAFCVIYNLLSPAERSSDGGYSDAVRLRRRRRRRRRDRCTLYLK